MEKSYKEVIKELQNGNKMVTFVKVHNFGKIAGVKFVQFVY